MFRLLSKDITTVNKQLQLAKVQKEAKTTFDLIIIVMIF